VCEVDIDCDDNMACSVDSCEDEGTRSAYEPVVCRDRTDCTVSGNIDEDSGVISTFEGTLTWTNTLIDGDCSIASTAVASNGHNIESPGNTCGSDHGTDLVNITEGQLDLGPLQDNGGLTMTHALGADSVAINHIPAVDCEVETDQRGEPRPETGGDACDVGSFERQSDDP
jgi:hypothetical protein